jgi:hypothetical protein
MTATDCMRKTYPGYFDDLAAATGLARRGGG